MEYFIIAITPRFTLIGVVVPACVPSMGQIELFNQLTVCKEMTDGWLGFMAYQPLKVI